MPNPNPGGGSSGQRAEEAARRLKDVAKDWEKYKCRLGGRRLRTACKTISPGDLPAFRAGQTVQYLVSERAADCQAAWDMPVNGVIQDVTDRTGLTYQDLAELHVSAFVPICLETEDGRHTCHPEVPPGREFYEISRLLLADQIRRGKINWRQSPRGVPQEDDTLPGGGGGGGGTPGGPISGRPRGTGPGTPAKGNSGLLLLAAAALLLGGS